MACTCTWEIEELNVCQLRHISYRSWFVWNSLIRLKSIYKVLPVCKSWNEWFLSFLKIKCFGRTKMCGNRITAVCPSPRWQTKAGAVEYFLPDIKYFQLRGSLSQSLRSRSMKVVKDNSVNQWAELHPQKTLLMDAEIGILKFFTCHEMLFISFFPNHWKM